MFYTVGPLLVMFCIYRVASVSQLKCMRFFAHQHIWHFIPIGSFYNYDDLFRRSYYCGQYLGACTSCLLQVNFTIHYVELLEYLLRDDVIIDAVISFGVGIIGFYPLPGTPQE